MTYTSFITLGLPKRSATARRRPPVQLRQHRAVQARKQPVAQDEKKEQ